MSREFASIMEAVAGDTVEEKIKVFSDVLDKITQFAVNTLDGLTKQVAYLQGLLQNMQQRIVKLEQRPIAVAPAAPVAAAPGAPVPAPAAAAPAPKPPPKPMSPMSARAALQGDRWRDRVRRTEHTRTGSRRDESISQTDPDDLPGPVLVAQSQAHDPRNAS